MNVLKASEPATITVIARGRKINAAGVGKNSERQMISRDRSREIRKHLRSEGWECDRDRDGCLVAKKDYVTRVYNRNGHGGYHESSGPTGVYVDEFGNI